MKKVLTDEWDLFLNWIWPAGIGIVVYKLFGMAGLIIYGIAFIVNVIRISTEEIKETIKKKSSNDS